MSQPSPGLARLPQLRKSAWHCAYVRSTASRRQQPCKRSCPSHRLWFLAANPRPTGSGECLRGGRDEQGSQGWTLLRASAASAHWCCAADAPAAGHSSWPCCSQQRRWPATEPGSLTKHMQFAVENIASPVVAQQVSTALLSVDSHKSSLQLPRTHFSESAYFMPGWQQRY